MTLILLYEYFHGDNGAGIGASHQTGWEALVAAMTGYFAQQSAEQPSLANRRIVVGEVLDPEQRRTQVA